MDSKVTHLPVIWISSQPHTPTSHSLSVNISDSLSWNTSLGPAGCTVIQPHEFVPWNNPDNIVSFRTEEVVRNIKDLFFLPLFFLIGCPANIINMIVFYKLSLKERINACLFALALADELHLVQNMMLYGEQILLQFTTKEMYGPIMLFLSNNNMFGFYGFVWVSQMISAIIACDRCICVLWPLRAQNLIRTSTITIIIVVLYVVIVGLFFIVATRYRITCSYDQISNTTMMTFIPSEFYYRHQQLVNSLDVALFGVALPIIVIVVVIIATLITTVKLRQAAHWRGETSSSGGLSQQEIALTKMLVSNSALFIACVIPFGAFRLTFFAVPEINPNRRHHNFFMMFKWIVIVISYVNSTFNIVVYYTMGTRYRLTLMQLFGKGTSTKSPVTSTSSTVSTTKSD